MKKLTRFIFMAVCCLACKNQEDMTVIDNWKAYTAPANKEAISNKIPPEEVWWVHLKNGTVHALNKENPPKLPFAIVEDKRTNVRISYLKVDDGFLLGFYRGEWGGSLNWFSANGKNRYKISDDEVVEFIKRGGKNYAIQGLNHLGISNGSIINIVKVNGKWKAQKYLELPNAPYAITRDRENNFLVVTSKSLFSVDSSATIHTLINRGLWWNQFNPTSITVKDSLVYIGMKGGVYRYNSYSGEKSWLMNH